MATFSELASTIRSRMNTNFGASYDIVYDNAEKKSASGTENSDGIWLRCSVVPGSSEKTEINVTPHRYRTYGVVIISIFTKVGEGDGTALTLAETVASKFRALTDTGVVFRTPYVTQVGRTENEWQINVTCPFFTDEAAS